MANLNERAELHKTIWQIANDLRGIPSTGRRMILSMLLRPMQMT